MLDAADDFSTSVFTGMLRLRDGTATILEHDDLLIEDGGEFTQPIHATLSSASQAIDEVHGRLPRVGLLFGMDSEAGLASHAILVALRNARMTLGDWPKSIKDSAIEKKYDRHFQEADEQHAAFVEAARSVIQRRWHHSARDLSRAVWRRLSSSDH